MGCFPSRKPVHKIVHRFFVFGEVKDFEKTQIAAPDRSTGKRRRNIRIEYDGIGFIPINDLTKAAAA